MEPQEELLDTPRYVVAILYFLATAAWYVAGALLEVTR